MDGAGQPRPTRAVSPTAVHPPTPMTHTLERAALSACLLVLFAAGCGRRQPSNRPAVTPQELQDQKGEPIEKQLQAKASGALISRTPDGGIAVQIRGTSSLYGSNEPLYVVDDTPIQPGPGGALMGINPHDIESIKILKDPADTGVYGMRGANGVILIKTKKPGKPKS